MDADERTMVASSSSAGEEVVESDCSADSFYERSFEAMESVLEASDVCRDSAVFSDHDLESDDSSTPPRYPPPPPPPHQSDASVASQEASSTTPVARSVSVSSNSGTPTTTQPATQELAKVKVPPPVPSKPKKTFRPSFTTGDLASIPLTALVSRLSEASGPAPVVVAPLAVPDVDDQADSSSQHSVASTVIEACAAPAAERSRRFSEGGLGAHGHGALGLSLGAGACPGACGTCPSGPTSKGWVKHVIGRLQGQGEGLG